MNHKVYVSYSIQDKPMADTVVVALEERGISCWIAPRDISPGTPWGSAIVEAIESSQAVVLIFSENANSSSQVAREVEMAISRNIDVIPFLTEDMKPSGALLYFLSTAHWINGYPPPIKRYLDEMVETIKGYLCIEDVVEKQELDEKKEKGQSIHPDDKKGLLKRLLGKRGNEKGVRSSVSVESEKLIEIDEKGRLEVVDTLKVLGSSSQGVIQFCVGDVTRMGPIDTVDVLVTSAFKDDYIPVPSTVFGSLYRKGIYVEDLAADKEVDLRGAFSCWLSKEIIDPPRGVEFKRLLCYEPSKSAKAGEQIGDIFRSMAPFIGGEDPIRTVATTLVAAGASRRITQHESLQLLVEAAVHWMSSGLPIEQFKIICLPNQNVKALTQLFAELKSRYDSMTPQRQVQFSYDYFISYSHQDTREVELFVNLLQTQKKDLRIFIDKKSLNPGSAWQREIYDAIDDCRKVATFFSPTYLDSKVCLEEFNIALYRHRESEEPILTPIFLYSANLPTYMKLIQFVDCRESNREKLQQAAAHLVQNLS